MELFATNGEGKQGVFRKGDRDEQRSWGWLGMFSVPIMQMWTSKPTCFLGLLKAMQQVCGRAWKWTESDDITQV